VGQSVLMTEEEKEEFIKRAEFLYCSAVQLTNDAEQLINLLKKDYTADYNPGIPGAELTELGDGWLVVFPGRPVNVGALRRHPALLKNEERKLTAKIAYHLYKKNLWNALNPRRAEVHIKIIHDIDSYWDPDNFPVSQVINAVKNTQLIKDDNWKNISYTVTGDVDKNNPRIEVRIKYIE